jgi:hypothetical protein
LRRLNRVAALDGHGLHSDPDRVAALGGHGLNSGPDQRLTAHADTTRAIARLPG